MTDKIYAIQVLLAENFREEDAEPIMEAIYMIRGVIAVSAHVTDVSQWAAEEKAKYELRKKLKGILA